ncbi:MAG: DNA repair protein RecO [Patescibacteria group bacterium]
MQAIVLSRHDFKETDQLVSLYTRERGKVKALAKGVKKITSKNSGNLSMIALLEVAIERGKELEHLTKVQPLKVFGNIFLDLEKLTLAAYMLKIIDDFILPNEKDAKVFNLIASLFEFLDSTEKVGVLNLATAFIFKFWHCLGFGSEDQKLKVWFESEWAKINSMNFAKNDQQKIHDSAIRFAEYHSGRKLEKFSGNVKMLGLNIL